MHPIIVRLQSITKTLRLRGLSDDRIRIHLKEELQNYILNFIYNSSEYNSLIFYGGTCLRKIYELDRLSEDLDFESEDEIDLNQLAKAIESYFSKEHKLQDVSASTQQGERISRVTVKFELLGKLDLHAAPNEKLHVKVEVNMTLKKHSTTEVTPVQINPFNAVIRHYPIETLMAGKMIACLERVFRKGKEEVYIKGRDYYDLIWYMQKAIIPNEEKLKGFDKSYTTKKVFQLLDKRVESIKPKDLYLDLAPFFESDQYIRTWCENFHQFYQRFRENYK